jgi:hypothetical protein
MRCLKLSLAVAIVAVIELSLLSGAALAEPGATTKKGCVGAVCFVMGRSGPVNGSASGSSLGVSDLEPRYLEGGDRGRGLRNAS